MPVHVDSSRSSQSLQASATSASRKLKQAPELRGPCVTVGLVNNMPESAFWATERQFVSLLESASEGISVCLSLYALPGIARPKPFGGHQDRYASVETLWNTSATMRGDTSGLTGLDGLIVTGREPITPNLRDEPYWTSFTEVHDWARLNTQSTVWSCLAAHAAVLHMDDIRRRKREDKHVGVYQCATEPGHPLTAGASRSFHVPHSRWNGVAEDDLVARGYRVLARTADGEVDTFVKDGQSLFVYFQGHPEYESDTLMREYRRDVGRYLRHEANTYPSIPRGYFDRGTEEALTALQNEALGCRSDEMLTRLAGALENTSIANTWRLTASTIYRNWLEYLCTRKNASAPDEQMNAVLSVAH